MPRAALLLLTLLLRACLFAAGGPVLSLWPDGAPGSEGQTAPEKTENNRVSSIHQPSLTVFLPEAAKSTGAALVVAPGGGHRYLAIEHEGWAVAKWLNEAGIAAFVLKYRLQRDEGSPYKVEVHALADAQRAVQLVRSRAAEFRINPARIGIIGFSAGGELAAMASARVLAAKADAADPLLRVSSRPDFQALIYPGKLAEAVNISSDAPPAFLLCADNDKGPAQAISSLYNQFKQAGVAAELHIYASGGHGFGWRDKPAAAPVASTWPARLRDWMTDRGFLSAR
jgi:endo-1,4-beta-xylanase